MRSPSCPTRSSRRVLVGGTEKLRGGDDYGVPLGALARGGDRRARARCRRRPLGRAGARAARALQRWRAARSRSAFPYEGADFRFDPPRFEPIRAAVDRRDRHRQAGRQDRGHRPRSRGCSRATGRVVVVAMGRGGPAEPELVEIAADGRRPARALARRTPCRLGPPRDSGADRRADRRLPPLRRRASPGRSSSRTSLAGRAARGGARPRSRRVRRQRRGDPADRRRPPHPRRRRAPGSAVATGYLNPYRRLIADLVVVTMAEDERRARATLARRVAALTRPGVPVVARRAAAAPARRRARAGASRSSAPRRRRSTSGSRRTSARRTAPTSSTSPATSPIAPRCASELDAARRGRRSSSSSRPPRSTSSPRRRSRAGSRSSSPQTTSCRSPASPISTSSSSGSRPRRSRPSVEAA